MRGIQILCTCIVLLCVAKTVVGTHFRYGHISWKPISTTAYSNITFTANIAFRRTFFSPNPSIGDSASDGNLCFGKYTTTVNGKSTTVNDCTPVVLTITSLDTAVDWIFGTFSVNYSYPAKVANYTAYYQDNARINALNNNAGGYWYISTMVNIGQNVPGTSILNTSPASNNAAIVYVYANYTNVFKIIASDTESQYQNLTFSLAPPALMGGPKDPNQVQPTNFQISSTGTVTWNTTNLAVGYWCAMVVISDGMSYVVLDFLLNVTKPPTYVPFFTSPTPTDGTVFNANIGVQSQWTLRAASNATANSVFIVPTGLPPGSTLSAAIGTNPVTYILTWTPSTSGAYVVSLQCKDSAGVYAVGQVSFTITVVAVVCGNGGNTTVPGCNPTQTTCSCNCPSGFSVPSNCYDCLSGYYGSTCKACPACVNGVCDDGIDGSGQCICNTGWKGALCNTPLGLSCNISALSYVQTTVAGTQLTTPSTVLAYITQNTALPALTVNFSTIVNVTVPALDVLVIVDNTASVSATMLANLQASATLSAFVNTVTGYGAGNNTLFALATFTNQITVTGGAFKLVAPLGTGSSFITYMGTLTATSYGGTSASCQLDAMLQACTNTGIGWRTAAFKIVVIITPTAFSEGGLYTNRTVLKAALQASNIVPIWLSPTSVSTYTSLVSSVGLGNTLSISSTFSGALTAASSQISTALTTVTPVVVTDTFGFVTSVSTSTTVTAPKNVTTFVKLIVPSGYVPSNTQIPQVVVNTVGFGTQTISPLVNRAPYVTTTASASTSMNTGVSISISAYDPDGNLLRVFIEILPSKGTLYISQGSTSALVVATLYNIPDGSTAPSFYYVPNTYAYGTDWFQYYIFDGCGKSSSVNASITVTYVLYPPNAVSQNLQTNESTALTVVLSATNPQNPSSGLTYTIATLPDPTIGTLYYASGAAVARGDTLPASAANSVNFVPVNYIFGSTAKFAFTATNSGGATSSQATISIYIVKVPNVPTAVGPSSVTVARTVAYTISLSSFDPDPEEAITFTAVSVSSGNGVFKRADGTTISNTSPIIASAVSTDSSYKAYATFTYTAAISATGTSNVASLSFFTTDAGMLNSTVSTIVVNLSPNNIPVAMPVSISVTQDQSSNPAVLTGTDSDTVDANNLQTIVTSLPTKGTLANKGVVITSSQLPVNLGVAPSVTYTTYLRGTDSFTFVVQDNTGAQSNTVTVPITITLVNHQPTIAITNITTLQNVAVSINASSQITLADADGDIVSLYVATLPVLGTLTSGGSVISAVNTKLTNNEVTYTPALNGYGSPYEIFSIYAGDAQGWPNSNTSNTNVNVYVTHVNQPPTVAATTIVILENSVKVPIPLSISDIDSSPLYALVSSLPNSAYGTLTDVNGNPITTSSPTDTTVYFTPNKYTYGNTSITIFGYDGSLYSTTSAIVTISIQHVNHAPTASATSPVTATRGVLLPITIFGSDPDVGDVLSFNITSYSPTDQVQFYTTSDLTTAFPVLTPFTVYSTVVATSTSVSSTTIYYKAPAIANSNPYATITFTVSDQTNTPSDPINLAINIAPNNAPSANPTSMTVMQDGSNSTALTGSDIDVADSGNLVAQIKSLPKIGTLQSNGVNITTVPTILALNTVIYSTNSRGSDVFTFAMLDNINASSADAAVTISIINVNHQPIAAAAPITTNENVAVTIRYQLSGSDIDGDTLTYYVATLPPLGTLSTNGVAITTVPTALVANTAVYTPVLYGYGSPYTNFTFFVNDNTGTVNSNSSVVTASIYVNFVNQPPVSWPSSVPTYENSPGIVFIPNVTDVDNGDGDLSAYIVSLPSPSMGVLYITGGSAVTVGQTIPSPRSLTFVPATWAYGSTSFSFRGNDGALTSSTTSVITINVAHVEQTPICSYYPQSPVLMSRESTVTISLTVFDPDMEEHTFYLQDLQIDAELDFNNMDGSSITSAPAVLVDNVAAGASMYSSIYVTVTPSNAATHNMSFSFTVADRLANSSVCSVNLTLSANTPPTANATGPIYTKEEKPTDPIQMAGMDKDPTDQGNLDVIIVSLPTHGRLFDITSSTWITDRYTVLAGDSVKYYPNDLFFGNDTYGFAMRDPAGGTSSPETTVTIIVEHVNHPPTISWLGNVTTLENVELDITSSISVFDLDSFDKLSVIIANPPTRGYLHQWDGENITSSNTNITDPSYRLKFVPIDFDYDNDVYTSFDFYVFDGTNSSVTITGYIFVTHVNQPPEAISSEVVLFEDGGSVNVPISAYDRDTPQENITATFLTVPSASIGVLTTSTGAVIVAGQTVPFPRTVVFTPATHVHTNTSFSFIVSDGFLLSTNTATVTLAITHVNHPPTSSTTSPVIVTRGIAAPITIYGMDVDTEDSLTFTINSIFGGGNITDKTGNVIFALAPVNVTTIANSNGGIVSYTLYYVAPADANQNPFAGFNFSVCDALVCSNTSSVVINIAANNLPVASPVGPIPLLQDSTSAPFSLNGTDADVIDNPLDIIIVSLPTKGALSIYGSGSNLTSVNNVVGSGQISMTYTTYKRGVDQFSYVVRDKVNGTSPVVTVTLQITDVNHPPTGSIGQLITNQNQQLLIDSISASDVDDNSVLSVYVTVLPTNGTITQYNGDAVLTVPTKINDLAFRVYYVPNTNQYGNPLDSFSVVAFDNSGAANNASANITAAINVTHVNQPPTSAPGVLNIYENSPPTSVVFSVSDIDTPLDNLSVIILSLPSPFLGNLVNSSGGLVAVGDVVKNPFNLTFVLVDYAHGSSTITFQVSDGYLTSSISTFTINVENVNQAPVASTYSPYVASRLESVAISMNVIDVDFPSSFDFVIESHNAVAGNFTNANGTVFPAGNFTLASNVSSTSSGAINTLFVYYTAPYNAIGSNYANMTFVVYDDAGAPSSRINVTININPGSPPTASAVDPVVFLEESISGEFTMNGTDVDLADQTGLTVVITSLPKICILNINGNNITSLNGTVTFAQDGLVAYLVGLPLKHGSDSFTFEVVDNVGFHSDQQTVAITINHVNHPPTGFATIADGLQDTPLVFTMSGIDPDNDKPLTPYIAELPEVGYLMQKDGTKITTLNAQVYPVISDIGTLTYVAPKGVNGYPVASMVFYTDDGSGSANSKSANITVVFNLKLVPAPPVAYSQNVTLNQNSQVTIVLAASDPQNYTMGLAITSFPAANAKFEFPTLLRSDGSFINASSPLVGSDNTVIFVPVAKDFGSPYASFSFMATSSTSKLQSNAATVTFDVIQVETFPPPESYPTNQTILENSQISFNLVGVSSKYPSSELRVVIMKSTKNGVTYTDAGATAISSEKSTTLAANAQTGQITLTYIAPKGGYGVDLDSITYYVIDPANISSIAYQIFFTVLQLHVAPTIMPISYLTNGFNRSWTDKVFIKENTNAVFLWTVEDPDTPKSGINMTLVNIPSAGSAYLMVPGENGTFVFGAKVTEAGAIIPISSDGYWRLGFEPIANVTRSNYATINLYAYDDTPVDAYPINGPLRSPRQQAVINVGAINHAPFIVVPQDNFTTVIGTPVTITDVTIGDPDASISRSILKIVMTAWFDGDGDDNDDELLPITITPGNDTVTSNLCTTAVTENSTQQVICYATIQKFNLVILKSIQFGDGGKAGTYYLNILVNDLGVGAEAGTELENELTAQDNITITVEEAAATAPNTKVTNNSAMTGIIAGSAAAGALFFFGAWRFVKNRKPPTAEFFGLEDYGANSVMDNPLYMENGGLVDNVLYSPPSDKYLSLT